MRIMSLGSNCADLAYLGEYRAKGPVDNFLVVNGLSDTLSLFSDFDQQMKNGFLSSKRRKGSYREIAGQNSHTRIGIFFIFTWMMNPM